MNFIGLIDGLYLIVIVSDVDEFFLHKQYPLEESNR